MAAIRHPGPGGTLNPDCTARYASEQLPAGLAAVELELAVMYKICDHRVSEDERLAGVPDSVFDHATRA